MYQRNSNAECMSALSPVLNAAIMGAPVKGLYRAARIACTMAAPTLTLSVSCGRKAPSHRVSLCPTMMSSRAGDWASMMCMSDKWPR